VFRLLGDAREDDGSVRQGDRLQGREAMRARREVTGEGSSWDGRRILHCDMDSFYASVHLRDDPSLAGKPVVIGGDPDGRGVIAAASYAARRYGVHSAMPSARARRLCPGAVFIRPDFTRYRKESERIFEVFRQFTSVVQTVALDEAYLDVSDVWRQWGSATEVAQSIRRRIRDEIGLTVSVGVGPNRLVAKIASDYDKPDGLTVVPPSRVREFLDPLPARRLPGVGPATERTLGELGIETIAQLRRFPEQELVRRLGRNGERLHRFARGIDERPVRVHQPRKSLSCERTYGEDLMGLEAMDRRVTDMAAEVAAGLQRRNLSARTLTLKLRYGDFTTVTRSLTLAGPTRRAEAIAEIARGLLRRTEAGRRPVRLLGVGAANLIRGGVEQLELFEGARGEE
jgi:DNA polymerase-4